MKFFPKMIHGCQILTKNCTNFNQNCIKVFSFLFLNQPNPTQDFSQVLEIIFFLTDNLAENTASSCPFWKILIGFYDFSIYKNYINFIFSYLKSAKNQITFLRRLTDIVFALRRILCLSQVHQKSDHLPDYHLTFLFIFILSVFSYRIAKRTFYNCC